MDRKHVEPVVEVFTKFSLLHGTWKIPVGRGNHTNIDLSSIRASDGVKLALLQNAQEFDLKIDSKFSDLIEKNRPSIRKSKPPFATLDRFRKSAFS